MTRRSDDSTLSIDATFHLVSKRRRRFALYYLSDQDQPIPLGELVEQVVIWDEALSAEPLHTRQEVRRGLENEHLPELQTYGVVEYDPETQMVELNDGSPVLASVVQHAKQSEPLRQSIY